MLAELAKTEGLDKVNLALTRMTKGRSIIFGYWAETNDIFSFSFDFVCWLIEESLWKGSLEEYFETQKAQVVLGIWKIKAE